MSKKKLQTSIAFQSSPLAIAWGEAVERVKRNDREKWHASHAALRLFLNQPLAEQARLADAEEVNVKQERATGTLTGVQRHEVAAIPSGQSREKEHPAAGFGNTSSDIQTPAVNKKRRHKRA